MIFFMHIKKLVDATNVYSLCMAITLSILNYKLFCKKKIVSNYKSFYNTNEVLVLLFLLYS